MAGIGFELKKLFGKKGYISNIRAYLYTALVTIGPTILCIFMITTLQLFLLFIGVDLSERELFLAAITYSFIFSLLITSGFAMIITRYISDRIFNKEYDEILPSLYGVLTICLFIGGIIGLIFYYISPLDIYFKLFAYILFMELIIIWLVSVYLSALSDYMRIVKGFLSGVGVTLACTYIFIKYLNMKEALGCLLAMDIGTFIIIVSFMVHIKSYFTSKDKGYFKFLIYLERYPSLFFISFFYTLGIYVHNFVFWKSSYAVVAGDTYVFCPFYDVPSFYAFFTIITAMVIFVVTVETSFYEKYKNYYSAVLGSGTLEDITRSKNEMYKVLEQEITFTMELQLFFTMIFMILGIYFLPRIGFAGTSLDIFSILVLGSYSCIIMFILILILLYFEDRKGALLVSSVFLSSNIIFSVATLYLGENFYGFGFFISTMMSMVIGFIRLVRFLREIEYYTFCSQPIIFKEKEGFFTRLIKKWDQSIIANNNE